jgi:hypothetical protein
MVVDIVKKTTKQPGQASVPRRFHSFGLSSIISLCCSTPILLTLVFAPAHSPCSADVSRRPIGRGSRQGSCLICNLRLTSARLGHIFAGKRHPSATSALRPGPPLPHLRRDWAHPCHSCRDRVHPCHICATTGLTPAISVPGPGPTPATSARGVDSSLPYLHPSLSHLCQDWAHWARLCHICAGTMHTRATSSPGLGSPGPHLHPDWAHPCHICTRLQRCARIGAVCTLLRLLCRSPCLPPSHSPPRPLPSPRITNRRSAPPFCSQSPLACACGRRTFAAHWAANLSPSRSRWLLLPGISLRCWWSCLLLCGPLCGGGSRSTFHALPFAPLLRCTRCAGACH